MGQYYKGSKIGTCESMYYMRLGQAQGLAALDAADDDGIKFSEYLADNVTRFRFPFPNEDGLSQKQLLEIPDYSPEFLIPAGVLADVEHREICISNSYKSGGSNVNIFIPCIHSKEFQKTGIRLSHGGSGEQWLAIKYQCLRDGEEKTIFQCPRCEAQQRFSNDDIQRLKEYAREHFKYLDCTGKNKDYPGDQKRYDYAMEIINRIK